MKFFYIVFFFFFALATASFAEAPLPADQAFQMQATAKDYQTILVHFTIAPNYYLYQQHFHFQVIKPKHIQLGNPLYPSDTRQLKTSLGVFDVYAHSLTIPIPIIAANEKSLVLQIHYQGCSKAGYCYPPTTKIVAINLSADFMKPASEINIDIAPISQVPAQNKFEILFDEHSLFLLIVGFLGFGILLSLTPCVLPMIPILSGIIIGKEKKHAFLLSLCYVFGMAITYAIAGILFGMIGGSVQTFFQKPWIIISFSFLFILMALSLFGLFTIQLPEKLRTKIDKINAHQKRGSYIGALFMGILSTLILSPCVTPPLVATLGFISQTGDALQGGIALFSMAIGMGVPLLLIGAFGSRLLPKSGRWMNAIKYFIGVLLIAVAISMLWRVIPSENHINGLRFQSVNSVSQIDAALHFAGNKIVMLDFYANWCIACKELEATTFRHSDVQKQLKQFVLLRADVTKNSIDDQLLEKNYGVIAPPTILFFENKQEIPNSRIIGFQPPQKFLSHLSRTVSILH